jgi:hypothetical protein
MENLKPVEVAPRYQIKERQPGIDFRPDVSDVKQICLYLAGLVTGA